MADLTKTIGHLLDIMNRLPIVLNLLPTYHRVPVVVIRLPLLEAATHTLYSLNLFRSIHHPTMSNRQWVPLTVQHPLDQPPGHIPAVNHFQSSKPLLTLIHPLIPPAFTPTVWRLYLPRLKVLHIEHNRIPLNPRLRKHLLHLFLQALGAVHLQEPLPGQLPLFVVRPLVHKAMAETTGTLWRLSTILSSKQVKDKTSEVEGEVVCQTGLQCLIPDHQLRQLAQAKVQGLKPRFHHCKTKVELIYSLVPIKT